ncbi:MAG: hypothetical protein KKD07_06455, partial [Candidatus Omnitrophica bacterium]|nr:hypothetical protein [Candidatus Omnitrophota bacterium]
MTGQELVIKMRISLVIFLITSYGFEYNLSIWQKLNESFNSEVKSIFIDANESNDIYVGTSKALFVSSNEGKDFTFVYAPSGESVVINEIYVPPEEGLTIFIATDAGLYKKSGFDNNWSRIFYSSNKEEAKCLAVKKVSGKIFLGTERGLLYKRSDSSNFVKIIGNFDNKAINQIKEYEGHLLIATNNEIFVLDVESVESKRIFFAGSYYGLKDEEEVDYEKQKILKILSTKLGNNPAVFVVTNNEIFYSYDLGIRWERIWADSIPVDKATAMVVND